MPPRETADADVGVPFEVCGDVRLLPALTATGHERTAGNRFERSVGDRRLVIDILARSYTGTLTQRNSLSSVRFCDEVEQASPSKW